MGVSKILEEFVKECSNKLDLYGIIQFGSSTYSKNPKDIDLVLFFNKPVFNSNELLELTKIIKLFENQYSELVFDFGGFLTRKRKAKYSITAVLLSKQDLNIQHYPHDMFFFQNLSLDKNKKILYGKDAITKFDIKLSKRQLFEFLSTDLRAALRKSLDDEKHKQEAIYFLFKTCLRAMLISEGHYKKEDLLDRFKEKFGDKILLPKNSYHILNKKLKKEDFESILKFSEDCLKYLIK